jgi:APA family basic amino acid/polyamine antiporter
VLTYMGFALGIFPVLTVAGVFRLRVSNPKALHLAGFPVTQIIYMAAGIMMLVLSFLERPAESSIALTTVAVGIPAYYIFKKYSQKSPE